ncbi:putative beta-lysine N-acetyltransferase [Desulfopila inferna]|uniref:putative beta-lysine N-acetyltransferase n=1 Tax=Desulfopila inferna TaxID=468528 RepID=UPI00196407DE|nr:putative beta-lysine N-acetyltransferase [Desulfopila inferna]MBM9606716.1 putative beta-lysine N-acetyltransferase [Desulfopila inferna]
MSDIIEKLHNSTIHHGSFNNRIFVLKLSPDDCPGILSDLDTLARKRDYTKIIVKVPAKFAEIFFQHGYTAEAAIPGYFSADNKGSEVLLMVKYRDPDRAADSDLGRTTKVLDEAALKSGTGFPSPPPPSYSCRAAYKSDTTQMAELYKKVFPTYPFPIDNPAFLAETMDNHCRYMGVWKDNQLVGLASADMDVKEMNAEMTDFATHTEHRGLQLAGFMLQSLEKSIAAEGIKIAYTIARSRSFGMNITFSRAGYSFAGTLINNTNISGKIESMNVWYKPLQAN